MEQISRSKGGVNGLPAYSVLMAVYAGENPSWFRESLQSMLDQTLAMNELVLVCDGPLTTALEAEVNWIFGILGSRMTLVRLEKQSGLGIAANKGLSNCRNEWIVRMDSDDIARPDRCRKQLAYAVKHTLDVTSAWVEEFSYDPSQVTGVRSLPTASDLIRSSARRRNPINHPCVAYKKRVVLAAGGYRDFPGFEDYDLWARLILADATFGNLPEVLLAMRAGEKLYNRRGGWQYARNMTAFWREMVRIGFVSRPKGMMNVAVRSIVSLMPNFARQNFYRKNLRNK